MKQKGTLVLASIIVAWTVATFGGVGATNDLWDVSQGSTILANSPLGYGTSLRDTFGASTAGVEPTQTVFSDFAPTNGVYFLEWRTASPVTISSLAIYASGDGQIYLNEREFNQITIKTKSPGSANYDVTLYDLKPSHPYQFQVASDTLLTNVVLQAPVTGQYFRAEIVPFVAGRGYDGPRLIELDAFGEAHPATQITTQPLSQTVVAGTTATFTVAANSSTEISYQWFYNGSAIAGGTNSALVLSDVGTTNAGTYYVELSNTAGTTTSANATLTVLLPPRITSQPLSQQVQVGADVTFRVSASSSLPVTYQWLFNQAPIAGKTNNSLILRSVTLGAAGSYSVIVSNMAGTLTSATATLGVVPLTGNGLQMSTADLWDVSRGTVVLTNSPMLSTSPRDMFGASSPGIEPTDSIFSNNNPPGGIHFVEWKTANLVAISSLALFAAGDGAIYRNQREFGEITIKTRSQGSTNYDVTVYHQVMTHPYTFENPATTLITNVTLASPVIGQYFRAEFLHWISGLQDGPRVEELDAYGQVVTGPIIVTQPLSQEVAAGTNVTFSVSATSDASYQWLFNNNPLAGQTNASLSLTNVTQAEAGTYTARVSSDFGVTVSQAAILNVIPATGNATIYFSNRAGTVDAPIFDATGTNRLDGDSYFAQLYAGASSSLLAPAGAAVSLQSGAAAGYFFDSVSRIIPGVTAGETVFARVKVWDIAGGSSYEAAVEAGAIAGVSKVISVQTGGGIIPPSNLVGLESFSVLAPPKINVDQLQISAKEGDDITLTGSVAAAGTVEYQWLFNGSAIAGATNLQYVIPSAQLGVSGQYQLSVKSSYGATLSSPISVNVRALDHTPPVLSITSPSTGYISSSNKVTVVGVASDDLSLASLNLTVNGGAAQSIATSTNGDFSVTVDGLLLGENKLTLVGMDIDGNAATNSLTVVWKPHVALALTDSGNHKEGGVVLLPVVITTEGDISGATFTLRYDTNLLTDAAIVWDESINGSFTLVNADFAGEINAAFAFAGSTLPAGTVTIANVKFRVRSIPSAKTTTINLALAGVYDAQGNEVTTGSVAEGVELNLVRRSYIADNNGNDRLDVGDASALLRYVTRLDPVQLWDIPANDLNDNGSLDSGDVIKVLRAVVGLDPQPSETNGVLRAVSLSSVAGNYVLTASKTSLVPGENITLSVNIAGNTSPLSGASFRLHYPTNALRLISSSSLKLGAIVPTSAAVLWNVSPAQNNFVSQDGVVAFAASSATSWPVSSGTVAELQFQVQSGASADYLSTVSLTGGEASSGVQVQTLTSAQAFLQGRDPVPLSFSSLGADSVKLRIEGSVGKSYRVDFSNDLKAWTALGGAVVLNSGSADIVDATPASGSRFYRIIQIQ